MNSEENIIQWYVCSAINHKTILNSSALQKVVLTMAVVCAASSVSFLYTKNKRATIMPRTGETLCKNHTLMAGIEASCLGLLYQRFTTIWTYTLWL